MNHRQAEQEAIDRLGARLIASTRTIQTTVALVYPEELRNHSDQALRDAIRDADLEYAYSQPELMAIQNDFHLRLALRWCDGASIASTPIQYTSRES